ncbi:MAG: hypothetical protein ABJO01_10870 [Parasphingorhabdus sp.]|uniref:hypothetical protein n=1 Tax=Parasphingorhabdus sp. TaxID=2709688 RepID=UPI003296899A
MLRKIVIAKALNTGVFTLCLTAHAHAETLQVEGLYPARSSGIADIQSIAIDRFGGSDGTALAFAIEDQLSGVEIDNAAYFQVIAGRSAVEPEATMTGTARTNIEEYETREYRQRCVERDENGKCETRKSIKVNCWKRVIDFEAQIRLSRFSDGQTVYAERKTDSKEETDCGRNESLSNSEDAVRAMINKAAYSVRRDLAPIERRENIRVLESRKGMEKATSKFFKAAVKMTKKDEQEACRMWGQVAANGAPHVSIAFNRGLCAEQEGALVKALDHYSEAQQLAGSKAEIGQAIRRVEGRQRALEDLEIRYASAGAGEETIVAENSNP